MKASVIITTYKRSDFLLRSINSCLLQDFDGSFEIIVVDDNGEGSVHQKQTAELLSELIAQNKIKYLVLAENSGACKARNAGVEAAIGEYIFLLDDDDEFLPSKIHKQVSFLDNNIDYDAHLCAFERRRNGKPFPSSGNIPIASDIKTCLMYGNFYTSMLCVKRSSYISVGGFQNIPKYQDLFFLYHLLGAGMTVYCDSTPLFIMNEHSGERISNRTVHNAEITVSRFREFVQKYKNLFTADEWSIVELRLTLMLATTYYSSSYINRLKSISFWWKCYNVESSKKYLINILKSCIPNEIIKILEGQKNRV